MQISGDLNLSTKLFIVGTTGVAFAGYLGGHCIKLFSASVIPAAHGLMYGAFPLMTVGVYLVAKDVFGYSPFFNVFIAMTAGYLASFALCNGVGLSITLAGPIASFTALAVTAGIVSVVALPIASVMGIALAVPFAGSYIARTKP